jgi:DDE superfamily endonuclease
VRDGPEPSPSVAAGPLGGAAGDAARAGGGPAPVLDGVGDAPRRGRGRRGGHGRAASGGATDDRSAGGCPSPSACRPPGGHEGTEGRLARPQEPPEPTRCERGQKQDHTVKTVLLIKAALTSLLLSQTSAGSTHDKQSADATPSPLPAGRRWRQALGFLAFTLPQVEIILPTRQPRGRTLTRAQQAAHRRLARRRGRLEHVNSRVKRCRSVHDTCRLRKAGVRDVVMDVCCGRHTFRVRLTPWQPMV